MKCKLSYCHEILDFNIIRYLSSFFNIKFLYKPFESPVILLYTPLENFFVQYNASS